MQIQGIIENLWLILGNSHMVSLSPASPPAGFPMAVSSLTILVYISPSFSFYCDTAPLSSKFNLIKLVFIF